MMQHDSAKSPDSPDNGPERGSDNGPEGGSEDRSEGRSVRLFTDGFLDPDALGDERTATVLLSAAERANERLRPGDILYAALDARDPAVLPAFEGALAEGAARITSWRQSPSTPRRGTATRSTARATM